jgi:phosphoribosyl-ATP pyrophosphohydrolase
MNKQEYLLDQLMEEAAEVIQAASKAIRFGIFDLWEEKRKTNKEALIDEINDFYGVIKVLQEEGILPYDLNDAQKVSKKRNKVRQFMRYAKERGTLKEDRPDEKETR